MERKQNTHGTAQNGVDEGMSGRGLTRLESAIAAVAGGQDSEGETGRVGCLSSG